MCIRDRFEVIEKTVSALSLAGPIDMDIFRIDGKYYISEINPRFGGGYPHAWHCNEMCIRDRVGACQMGAIMV